MAYFAHEGGASEDEIFEYAQMSARFCLFELKSGGVVKNVTYCIFGQPQGGSTQCYPS